ncbi:MAG: ribosome recycling factor [Candidatus Omnitrophota bacterium]|nr:MAG: ribosome recycling factor [Candidatus Omnitrophota bacterium]
MTIKDILYDTENKMRKTIEAVKREFSEVRTGRASPSLVEGIMVEYYGAKTPIKQLATISTPDARLIAIHPWDPSIISQVEKAILQSNVGLTPNNDGKIIRISMPHLTDERRQELDRIVKRVAENGRVSLRTARRDANESLKQLDKSKEIAEDERFKSQDRVQKLIDKYSTQIDDLLKTKEKEIQEG